MSSCGTITEIASRENGYKWLVIDDSGNRHWLAGNQFVMNAPRDLNARVKLTVHTTSSYSLVFAGKAE